MIPDWRAALRQGVQVTGGTLALVDFGQQERLPDAWRRLLFVWLGRFDVTPRAELEAALDETGLQGPLQPLYRGYAWAAELRRYR